MTTPHIRHFADVVVRQSAKATIAAATALTGRPSSAARNTPAHDHPAAPPPALRPVCLTRRFSSQDNGWQVFFLDRAPRLSGAGPSKSAPPTKDGTVSAVIHGRNIDFTSAFGTTITSQHYFGALNDEPWCRATAWPEQWQYRGWHSTSSARTAAHLRLLRQLLRDNNRLPPIRKQLSPGWLSPSMAQRHWRRGASETYNVNVSNPGDVSAPVELFVSFNGQLQQAGFTPSGGFNCDVQNYSGGTSSVHCTVGQFGSKATATIVVQGRGSAPGAGGLDVNINSADPAAQFVQKSQKLNVTEFKLRGPRKCSAIGVAEHL